MKNEKQNIRSEVTAKHMRWKKSCRRVLCLILAAGVIGTSLPAAAFAAEEKEVVAPAGLLLMKDGRLLITDVYRHALWVQEKDGSVKKVAGREVIKDVSGGYIGSYCDGTAAQAAFDTPWAAAPFLVGYAVSDTENHCIRYWHGNQVETVAGSGTPAKSDGAGIKASLNRPTGLAAGADGCVYIADTGNHVIRKLDGKGNVTTYAGGGEGCAVGSLTEARFREPVGLYYAEGALYVADSGNNRICKIEKDVVSVVAGGPQPESGHREEALLADGPAESAAFTNPQGVLYHNGILYVADTGNGAIRKIQNGQVTTVLESGQGAGGIYPVSPCGMAMVNDTLYVGDIFGKMIFSVSAQELGTGGQGSKFLDVWENAWYAAPVAYVSEKKIMSGVGGGMFSPDAVMDRAMAVTALYQMEKSLNPAVTGSDSVSFPDMKAGSYYLEAVSWAQEQGIVQGTDGFFYPQRPVTRAEFIAMMYRDRVLYGGELPESALADLSGYADLSQVEGWAVTPFRWACGEGIIAGKDGNRLAPQELATRAEMAAIIQRYCLKR